MEQNFPEESPIPTPIAPTPATESVRPVKSSGFLVVLLSILLIISVLIAGFFAYQTQNLVKEITKLQVTPTPIATVEPEPTTDPTADWETYTDNTYLIEFKYPSTWTTEVKHGQTEDSIITRKGSWVITSSLNHPPIGKTGDFGMGVSVSSLSNYKTIPMLGRNALREKIEDGVIPFNGAGSLPPEPYYLSIDFQGKPGEGSEYNLLFSINNPLNTCDIGIVITNIKLTKSNITNHNIDSKELEEIDQILSTFKFIEPEASPTTSPQL